MIATTTIEVAQGTGGLGTSNVRHWNLNNPILPLVVALLLWLGGGKGDRAGVMRRLGGVIVPLAIIGLAVTADAGKNIGMWIAGLLTRRASGASAGMPTVGKIYRVDAVRHTSLRAAMP